MMNTATRLKNLCDHLLGEDDLTCERFASWDLVCAAFGPGGYLQTFRACDAHVDAEVDALRRHRWVLLVRAARVSG